MGREKSIEQILKRLDRLEKTVFGGTDTAQGKKSPRIRDSKKISLTKLILQLREKGFFKEPKTAKEVHIKLLPLYHCESDRVDTALRRLKERKELRITSKVVKNKKAIAYVW